MPTIRPNSDEAVAEACTRLRTGRLVGFPTETVYGLGGHTMHPGAIAAIYDLKGRPAENPLIAHVLDAAAAKLLVGTWDVRAASLADRFWPGPLTLVLPAAPSIPSSATGGRPTIALRSPAHPVARALLERFGGPISAPSANRSGHVSPTSAEHVAEEFPDSDLLIIDGGPCGVGIESTVLDLTTTPARILRPGSISRDAIEAIIGPVQAASVLGQAASPGTAERHYAPRTPARLMGRSELERLVRSSEGSTVVGLARQPAAPALPPHRSITLPADPAGYAHRLYAALREADAARPDLIAIEAPPGTEEWTAINDRLRRACSGATGS